MNPTAHTEHLALDLDGKLTWLAAQLLLQLEPERRGLYPSQVSADAGIPGRIANEVLGELLARHLASIVFPPIPPAGLRQFVGGIEESARHAGIEERIALWSSLFDSREFGGDAAPFHVAITKEGERVLSKYHP